MAYRTCAIEGCEERFEVNRARRYCDYHRDPATRPPPPSRAAGQRRGQEVVCADPSCGVVFQRAGPGYQRYCADCRRVRNGNGYRDGARQSVDERAERVRRNRSMSAMRPSSANPHEGEVMECATRGCVNTFVRKHHNAYCSECRSAQHRSSGRGMRDPVQAARAQRDALERALGDVLREARKIDAAGLDHIGPAVRALAEAKKAGDVEAIWQTCIALSATAAVAAGRVKLEQGLRLAPRHQVRVPPETDGEASRPDPETLPPRSGLPVAA